MLNVINGFYKPTSGTINFAGTDRGEMEPEFAAKSGIARTFQNIALFKGMSTLDNLMTGRLLKQKQNFLMQALYFGPAEKEEEEHREKVERVIDFLDLQSIRRTPVGSLPYGLQKRVELGRALAMEPEILLLDEPIFRLQSLRSYTLLLALYSSTNSKAGRPICGDGSGKISLMTIS